MRDPDVEYRGMLQAYATVFGSPLGQQVLEDLRRSCFVNKTSFVSDPYQSAFNEGMREVVLLIQRAIQTAQDTSRQPADPSYTEESYNV